MNIADRDYFIYEHDNPNGGLFISKPLFGRVAKTWVITIARRINNTDGSFAGIVYGGLALDQFIKSFSAIDVGKNGSITLRDTEMALIVRYPELDNTIGTKTVSKKLTDLFKAGNKSATYRAYAGIDNTERLISYRQISDYPLVIIVALAKEEYLAEWQNEILKYLGLAAIFTMVTLFSSRMLLARWKHEKEIENELRKSWKQMEDIINFLPDATLAIDKNKRVIIWNRAIEEMTGISAREMIGRGEYVYTIPFYGVAQPHLIDLLFKACEKIPSQYINVTRKGNTVMGEAYCKSLYNSKGAWVFAKAAPLYDQSGEFIGAIEIIRDITESKQAFEQIETLSKRLNLAVSSGNLGVWDWTITDNHLVWNDRMFELYGIAHEAFLGNIDAWLNGLHPEDKEEAVSEFQAALNGEKKFDTIFRVRHPDGTVKHIKAYGVVIRGANGTAEQMIGINSDITEIKRAEEEKAKLEYQLLLQSRLAAMGEMINNIAHQWRQPLNNIGLIVQNLQYSFASGELTKIEFDADVDTIMQIAKYMSSTINDFRNFFRQDKEKCAFLISIAVIQATGLLTAALKDGYIDLELQLDENVEVFGYMNEYMQALLNIIANAKDVLLERAIKEPRIAIRAFSENSLSVVTVRDNAGGIDEKILPKVFDPYFTTKGAGNGTGIGLYMSKIIIEKNMGGRLTVSNIPSGAEFRIEV
ncbi:MAG: PAS domain-containing protein [Desulfuromonadaceae bacterium]|nr:PAS domain-containing protein [Desulfuromonadaceae bacterium]